MLELFLSAIVKGTYSQDLLFAEHLHVTFVGGSTSVLGWHRRIDIVILLSMLFKGTVIARRRGHKKLVLQGLHGELTRYRMVVNVVDVQKKEVEAQLPTGAEGGWPCR